MSPADRDLRDLMHRVADDVAPARIAPDTWSRARRARTRDRALVTALVTVLVVGGVVAGLRPSLLPDVVAPVDRPSVGGAGAVPERIHAVPERLDQRRADGTWSSPSVPARTVQRAAAAYVTTGGRPVLVSAVDGEHHLVDLPGFDGAFNTFSEEVPVAVSPDGRRVAYDWRTPEQPATGRWPSGVAVLALDGGGGATVHRLDGGVGVKVGALSWSPNGRFLVYRVTTFATVHQGGGFTTGDFRLERLDVGTGERVVVGRPGRSLAGPPSVSDDGVVALAAGELLVTWSASGEPRRAEHPLPGPSTSTSAWAADGVRVAVAVSGPGAPITVVDTRNGSTEKLAGADAQEATVVGWVGDRHVLLSRHPRVWAQVDLVLLDTTTGESAVVGAAAGPATHLLSVATGLMTPERPTVEMSPPWWVPWHVVWRSWLEVAGGLVLLAGLVYAWRRARRRDAGR